MRKNKQDRAEYIAERVHVLSMLFLSRRKDLAISVSDKADLGVDYVVDVRNGNGASYRRFGIIAKGFWDKTSLGQPPELEGISRLLGGHEYPFPVALFAFTMEENLAFYSWIMEPAIENGAAQLRMRKRGLLQELTFSNLDKLLDDVNAWYDAFFTALVRSN